MMKSSRERTNSNLRVTVYWGDVLYDTTLCRPLESITVGRNDHNTYIFDLPNPSAGSSLELVRMEPDGTAAITFDESFRGHIKVEKQLLSLSKARQNSRVVKDDKGFYHTSLRKSENADFVVGHVSFYLDWIDKEERIAGVPLIQSRKIFLSVILFALLVTSLVDSINPTPLEKPKPPERLVKLVSNKRIARAAVGENKSATGGAQKGDPGKADLAPKAEAKISAAEKVKNLNLGRLVGGLKTIADKAPSASGSTAGAAAAVPQVGNGGFSTEGLRNGGGGKSVGVGRTVGQGEGGFEGTGRLGLSGNSPLEGGTGHGNTDANPKDLGLDRDLIDSIIRRRQDRIRLCYERQLNFNPKLAGKVGVHFVIDKTGAVAKASIMEDTMKNDSVGKCILVEAKSWTFPKPKGGVSVDVQYPFFFESSSKH